MNDLKTPSDAGMLTAGFVSAAVFGSEPPFTDESTDWEALLQEALSQAVFPLVYTAAEKYLPPEASESWRKLFFNRIGKNIRVSEEHSRAGSLFRSEGIRYVILKGCSCAHYYPDSQLRILGDVDIYVDESDFQRASDALIRYGYAMDKDTGGKHVAFRLEPGLTLELHRKINGIPQSEFGERCNALLADIIESSVTVESDGISFEMPDTFHQGLVVLLHSAEHMTRDGLGLRHLCDWAVFYSSLTDEEFSSLFEAALKSCGVWRFAQLLTLVCVKYLHSPERIWAGKADEELVDGIFADIIGGGNFGTKDKNRLSQIKYISNRGNSTVDGKGAVTQVFLNIGKKSRAENKSVIRVVGEYAGMLLTGKRKKDSINTIKKANSRKMLYKEFHLFEPD